MINDNARAVGLSPRGKAVGGLACDCLAWLRGLPQTLPYGRGSDGWTRIAQRRPMSPGLPVVLVILFNAATAWAHGVTLECEVRPPDRIVVTVYWGGTEPAVGAAIAVTDIEGHKVASGTSDENGSYTFTATARMAYAFEATLAGHRARRRLSAEEVDRLDPGALSSTAPTARSPALTSEGSADRDHGHDHASPTEHAQADTPRGAAHTEALAGVALILSAASFIMIISLRRRLDRHLKRNHGT
jgi:hypothetical protein